MSWSLGVYTLSLVIGLGFAVVVIAFGEIFGADHDIGAGHDVALGHDLSAGHDIGTGHDVAADHGIEGAAAHVGAHASPLSAPVIAIFLTGFGGAGLLAEKSFGLPPGLSMPISTATGLALGVAAFLVIAKIYAVAQASSAVSAEQAIGLEAEVIISIPATGVGEIVYILGGRRFNAPARSEDSVDIPLHSVVRISRLAGSTAIVRELADERLRRLKAEEPGPAAPSESG